jgi:nitric oxide dioxygenase
MTERQIQLVENSWDFIILNTSEAGELFYGRLFQIDPELRKLFKDDNSAQAKKLVNMITFVVHKLGNLDEIVKDVVALGERHAGYHVKPEYYGTVANALLWTLEKALGDQWNEEMKEAWVTAYTILSTTMIKAAAEKAA